MEPSGDTLDILPVEDNPGDAGLIETYLNSQTGGSFTRLTLTHVETLDAGVTMLRGSTYDLLVLGLALPESTGLATLERCLDRVDEGGAISPLPVVVLTRCHPGQGGDGA